MNDDNGIKSLPWWKQGAIYQIYPKSFYDSTNNGVGDLMGIIEKIPYVKSCGFNAIWLSPIYCSPHMDGGYDITDFYRIDPLFGTIEDFHLLIETAHRADIRIIMDMVMNHCSIEHRWFQSAMKGLHSPYRDYFIWRKGKDDNLPPNNWNSFFGGSAWTKIDDWYYLHMFGSFQPDLNWENKDVREQMYKMMQYWIDLGVDGFRLDAFTHVSKEPSFCDTDNSLSPVDKRHPYVIGPKLFEYMKEMRERVFDPAQIVVFAEASGVEQDNVLDFVGGERPLFDMVLSGELIDLDRSEQNKYKKKSPPPTIETYVSIIASWQKLLHGKGTNCNFHGNHDQPRAVSRFGDDVRYQKESAKALLFLLLSLEGVPLIYQGEEIGMKNSSSTRIEDIRDIDALQYLHIELKKNRDSEEILKEIQAYSRDNARTPMQWSRHKHGGFTQAPIPWIPSGITFDNMNVLDEKNDEDSVLTFFTTMLTFRKKCEVLLFGEFELLTIHVSSVVVYKRKLHDESFLCLLNLSSKIKPIKDISYIEGLSCFMSTYAPVESVDTHLIQPWEGRMYYKREISSC